ncbi:MAG: phosphoglucosamine mutase [Solirubrobacterales bacterium]
MAVVPQTTRLFGTDGVRGPAGSFLTSELAFALGRAATEVCASLDPSILVVRDTRVSGEMLEAALSAGIAAGGGHALLAGILPTPAASLLVRRHDLEMAVVISASHNPARDNGIKFFGARGRKLPDDLEADIERRVNELQASAGIGVDARPCGRVRPLAGALDDYLRELGTRFRLSLEGKRVLLDCANGATYRAAPTIFERLGAQVERAACEPDGLNINADCGSTHVGLLRDRMRDGGFDVGFAFDGDGDRVLALDPTGTVIDGDEIIAAVALDLKARGEPPSGVAVTVMTNFGFHLAMKAAAIEVATTNVGDRYVVEELDRRGWTLGGEQSGHIVDMRFTPSGDGIASALLLLESLGERPLEAGASMTKLPQQLVNVRVADRDALAQAQAIWDVVQSESASLEGRGRVLLRPSGTEPVIRVMVEAPTAEACAQVAERLAAVVEQELGSRTGKETAN